jgi:hypothetical protein
MVRTPEMNMRKAKSRIDGYQAQEVPGKQKDEFHRPHGHHRWLCPEGARVDMELS